MRILFDDGVYEVFSVRKEEEYDHFFGKYNSYLEIKGKECHRDVFVLEKDVDGIMKYLFTNGYVDLSKHDYR